MTLTSELKKSCAQVLTTLEERYAYSQDAGNVSGGGLADAVVFVENVEQIQEVVRIANKYKTPIICRGAGTNVVGACVPVNGGIVLNFCKMNKILEINAENMSVRVQPGVIVGDLHKAVEAVGLFYPPDPSALAVSTIGGSIAQASAGAKTFKYGTTKDYVLALTIVTASGEILHTGSNTIKNATGYNLSSLFVGSEGTLGIVAEAVLKLIPKPQSRQVVMAYFDTVEAAVNTVNKIISHRMFPSTIDFMDKTAMQIVGISCDKESALIIEVEEDLSKTLDVLENAADVQYSKNEEEYEKIWAARRASMAACAQLKPNVTTDDVTVPRQNLAKLVKGIQAICAKYDLICCLIGHVGDGSVHPQIPIDFRDEDEYARYKLAKNEIYELTASLDGVLSGEHGIGLLKREHIGKVVDPLALQYMREIKKVFDPNNILNPDKIFIY